MPPPSYRTPISWRSGLEEEIGTALKRQGVPFEFEGFVLPFLQPAKKKKYTPDFALLHNGIVVESKGHFVTADRQKHLLIQTQYPDLDLRFVFSRPNNKIGKKSKTTYAIWCDSNGFQWATREIPRAWLNEPLNAKSLAVIKEFLK